ncbi:sugar ABC transporter permease [Shouchella clausii]|jgi:sn-glycerol 3-phosphate transport system permease protein|uniref:carbohydrate ABC transporter permease n=1 Tax=Shouchella clausii TaxID=79880 RepID=UPI0031FD48D0
MKIKPASGWLQRIKPLLFIAPAMLPIVLFIFVPLVRSIYWSFLEWNMVSPTKTWVGLDNYVELFSNREFINAAANTLWYMGMLLVLILFVPYMTAYGVTQVSGRWQHFYRGALFVPHVLSLAVASVIFLWLYNPLIGSVNEILRFFQLPDVNWLNDANWALFAITLVVAWNTFGYHFIVLLAGILSVPEEVKESARVEGMKSKLGMLRRIVFPLTGPTILFVFVLTTVMGIQFAFVPIQMLTNGGPDQSTSNLVFLTYQYGFQFFRTGLGSATAVLTFLFFVLIILLQAKVLDRRVHYES